MAFCFWARYIRRVYPDRRCADAADGAQSVPLRRQLFAVFAYSAVGPQLPELLRVPIDALYRFGFGGYLLQESYSWVFPYLWSDVWKPVLLEIGMILLEFFIFLQIWRRKAKA